jgi:hypothetical protein
MRIAHALPATYNAKKAQVSQRMWKEHGKRNQRKTEAS